MYSDERKLKKLILKALKSKDLSENNMMLILKEYEYSDKDIHHMLDKLVKKGKILKIDDYYRLNREESYWWYLIDLLEPLVYLVILIGRGLLSLVRLFN